MDDEDIIILVESAQFVLYPWFFDMANLARCKKIFKYAFREEWRNENSIERISEYLTNRAIETKADYYAAPQHGKRKAEKLCKQYLEKLAALENGKNKELKRSYSDMYQNIATKVLTGEVRLSYAHLTAPRAAWQGQDPKYGVTLLIPKTDKATIADINASMKAAYDEGVSKKWGGAHPQPKAILHDGDGLRPSGLPFGEECKGHYVLTASTKDKPQVVGIDNINCELAPQDVYSGMYARVTINFFPFDTAGNKGVGCGLGHVLKTRDGEPLSSRTSAASDFAGIAQSVPQVQQYNPQQTSTRPPVNPITGLPW